MGEWWMVQGVGTIITSPSSWTDNELYQLWFKKVFLLHAASRNTSGKHILLITNGHGSHEHLDIVMLAFKHKVLLYSLPPYTTQLQPLDVGVFGPVQNVWAHQCQIAAVWGSPISTKMVIQEYLAVHNETMTTRLVKSAFRHTGIWPFNASLFTLLNFAPVMLTSTHSLGPPSYPTHFPSSPDMAQTTDGVSLASQESTESSESMAGNHSDEDMAKARFDEMEFSNHDSASWDDESGSDNESEPLAQLWYCIGTHSRMSELLNTSANPGPPSSTSSEAQKAAAEAHSIMHTMESEQLCLLLHTKEAKSKCHRLNTNACLLTAPEAEEEWHVQDALRIKRETAEAAKKLLKQSTVMACELVHGSNAFHKTFNAPLQSYKCKDDLKDPVTALTLNGKGTIPELQSRIKTYLESHPDIAANPHFVALLAPPTCHECNHGAPDNDRAPQASGSGSVPDV
ncbi:hypothetical protein K439DRAFT_1621954 [Ramaria rubella]|nr:hypothetical protein K439DRAFT_1621954 [Ramaria rubella]